ncbi:TetR/AcrR family transcriptional regulator [Zhouia sp. PK063]|uniref:TetR/AcrR family transcriptional regulator n=1 Tax=Zhouia sp. PK063 TaxID=3373602 RepID=UPI003797DC22
MGSKERILRMKEETRKNILEAALTIVQEEGWEKLSMRKIADKIEYTAPIIYEYFSNKNALLEALTKKGFICLDSELDKVQHTFETPAEQLQAMWMKFWDFAFNNQRLYQVMYGVEMTCCMMKVKEAQGPYVRFMEVIKELMKNQNPSNEEVKQKYFTFFSVIHGLISINLVGNGLTKETNDQILSDAINGIIHSLN